MHTIVNSPDNFIIVAGECEVLELNILDYIAKLAEI